MGLISYRVAGAFGEVFRLSADPRLVPLRTVRLSGFTECVRAKVKSEYWCSVGTRRTTATIMLRVNPASDFNWN